MIYDLELVDGRYKLTKKEIIYTRFKEALEAITKKSPGEVADFIGKLQAKLDLTLKGIAKEEPLPDFIE